MDSFNLVLGHYNSIAWNIGLGFIGWFSSIVAFFAYFPGTIRIMINRQTASLNSVMWWLMIVSLIALVIYGGCLGGQAQAGGWGPGAIASGYSMVVFDGISVFLCAVVIGYKIYNQHQAKLQNTTEQRICEIFIAKLEKRDQLKFEKKHHLAN